MEKTGLRRTVGRGGGGGGPAMPPEEDEEERTMAAWDESFSQIVASSWKRLFIEKKAQREQKEVSRAEDEAYLGARACEDGNCQHLDRKWTGLERELQSD